jgi:uncharacterized protein
MIGRARTAAATGLAAVFAMAVAAPAGADEIGPGFDCKKAATAVEKAICKDAYLGFRDSAMTRLYGVLRKRLQAGARDALIRSQAGWLKARDRACGGAVKDRANCLLGRYDARIAALAAIAAHAELGERPALTGSYGHKVPQFNGTVAVVEVPGEPAWVEISTVNGPTYHLCDLSTRSARRRGATIIWTDADERACRVTLTFTGGSVTVGATRQCHQYYCGVRGAFAGITYKKALR